MTTHKQILNRYRPPVVWIVTFLLLAWFSPPAATAPKNLNNLLLELESNINDEAWDEEWDNRYENWEQECQQAKQPQVMAKLLLELESYIKWKAVTDKWQARREGWMEESGKATTGSQVAKLLLEFETYLRKTALDEEWQEVRQTWREETKKWLVVSVPATPAPASAAPVITWLYPANAVTTLSTGKVMINACIKTSGPLVEKAQIYVNNTLLSGNSTRQLEVVKSGCDVSLGQVVPLQEGKNQIRMVARNAAGKTVAERTIHFKPVSAKLSEKRTALVIGNSNYARAPLRNPVNDANAMATKLQRLGFEVLSYTNLGQTDMKRVINEFGDKLAAAKGGVGLFYFAGHGVQVKGENYLIPIDANIRKENEVELEAVSLGRVLGNLENAHNRMNIVILDACRDSPYERSFRSQASQGLVSPTAPYGTVVAFATAPGSVTADGEGNNGIYTEELLKVIESPSLKLEEVFKQVLANVRKRTQGSQIPWYNAAFEGDFYFKQ